MTRLLIIGPPGSGKGTQAHRLSEQLGVVEISTGDMFRTHLAAQTPLGIQAQKYLDSGDLVPDHVTTDMVRERLSRQDVTNGFLLDGYPRTVAQMNDLDAILESTGNALEAVLEVTVGDEEIVRRLLRRAGIEGRSDDTEDVIRHRLQLYREETEPLIARYAERGILVRVDGTADVDQVTASARKAIETLTPRTAP
ncbi:adenylate kinase [Arthrobacter pascens]|uniref:adenylate kinase n=1 Tax=Arthrobacter pascens TaxID=1677 RepID=UPI00196AE9F6|nr:adenylate kinase [Arthrobacter pascens]MBN3496769.1 adenylate kinase [Arthrobacter pascens]MDR6559442.1 adenylate kinase [Arthrobacter pascens]